MPGDNGNDDGNNGNGNNGDNGGTPPPGDNGKQTFSQDEVNRIITERLERDRRTRDAKYVDYDDFKKAAEELKKLQDADLSEQEKLKNRITELEQAQADWDAKTEAQAIEVNEKLVRAEVRMVAATMDFWKPEQAYKLADLTGVETDEDGQVKGVKKALEKLAKDSSHLIKTAGGPGSPANVRGKPPSKDAKLDQAVEEARQIFNIRDYSPKK